VSACGRVASRKRNAKGSDNAHCRSGLCGKSSSASSAALSAIRRAPQLGQTPRPLQLNATRFSAWQRSQRTRRKPCSIRRTSVKSPRFEARAPKAMRYDRSTAGPDCRWTTMRPAPRMLCPRPCPGFGPGEPAPTDRGQRTALVRRVRAAAERQRDSVARRAGSPAIPSRDDCRIKLQELVSRSCASHWLGDSFARPTHRCWEVPKNIGNDNARKCGAPGEIRTPTLRFEASYGTAARPNTT
jgi:hypothetical protein